jgi:dihydroorotate dehydrogenase
VDPGCDPPVSTTGRIEMIRKGRDTLYSLWRHLLFRYDPERVHEWTVRGLESLQSIPLFLSLARRFYAVENPGLDVSLWGLSFPNPVGLAAGFDKNATIYPALSALGFGYIEVGTITPLPQPGNRRPRLFRLTQDEAIINRMGFNNRGARQAMEHFSRLPRPRLPIGVNLGKNRNTPNEQAFQDYRCSLRALYRHGDYFVINISSPNTKGLRELHRPEALKPLLEDILGEREVLREETGEIRPLLLKISPDLTDEALEKAVDVSLNVGMDGFIATNTTLSRDGIASSPFRDETGGLSGRPLAKRSTEIIRRIHQQTGGRVPIIGVGGIFSGEDAYEKIRAGASLVQVYTGMIYRGPSIARKINQELLQLLKRDGLSHIQEAVGRDA